jgi:hypothetical protein
VGNLPAYQAAKGALRRMTKTDVIVCAKDKTKSSSLN